MTQHQQTPGDYGYDLAHEERGDATTPATTPATTRAASRDTAPDVRPGDEHVDTPPVSGPGEPGEDLGYDEAHDF